VERSASVVHQLTAARACGQGVLTTSMDVLSGDQLQSRLGGKDLAGLELDLGSAYGPGAGIIWNVPHFIWNNLVPLRSQRQIK
jgi:hypothetical protein